jgi:NDP-sugar pyrophosphorylase family protein
MNTKKGVILAGGEGKRLHPITLEIPKPLLPVRKKPLINYSVEMFLNHGVNDIRVITRPEDREDFNKWLQKYKSDFSGAKIELVEEQKPMGTFGFVAYNLSSWVGDGDFFMTNSDDIKDVDLSAMYAFHKSSGGDATVALVHIDKPEEYGATALEGDTIVGFLEKQENPPSDLVSVGVYIFSPTVFNYVSDKVKSGVEYLMVEKDLFPQIASKRKLKGFVHTGKFFDCGTLERWERALREV